MQGTEFLLVFNKELSRKLLSATKYIAGSISIANEHVTEGWECSGKVSVTETQAYHKNLLTVTKNPTHNSGNVKFLWHWE